MREVLDHQIQLLKDSFVYGLSRAGSAFIGLLLLPVYTRALSPAEYGAVELIAPGIGLLVLIVGLQIESGVARHYYEVDGKPRRTLLSTGLLLRLPLPVLCLCLLPWAGQISQAIFGSPIYGGALSFALFSVPLRVIFSYFLVILRFERAAVKYTILAVGHLLALALFSIYFVIHLHKGVEGVFLGFFLADLAFTFATILFVAKYFTFTFSHRFARDILSYGVPIVPATIAGWFRTYMYRFLLIPIVGLAGVGIFSSAVRVSTAVLLIISAFRLAWGPFAMSLMHDEKHKLIYSKTLTYFIAILATVALLLTLFSYEIIHLLLPPSYWDSHTLIGFLTAALILDGGFGIVAIGLSIVKKTYLITASFLVSIAFGATCLILLVPHVGIIGAAMATLLGAIAMLLTKYYLAQHNYYISYDWKRFLGILLLLIAFIPLTMLIDSSGLVIGVRIGMKIVAMGVFLSGLWGLLPRREVLAGLAILRQRALSSLKARSTTNPEVRFK